MTKNCIIFATQLLFQFNKTAMNLPQDPYMKSQYVNMLLKANNMDLKTLCLSAGINMIELQCEQGRAGIRYDAVKRQFTT